MAGTTINEDNVVYKTLHKAINDAGFSVSLDEVLEQGAGKEKQQAIKSILQVYANTTDDLLVSKIYSTFLIQLEEAYHTLVITPQPNADQLFNALHQKNIRVIMNTGYNRKTAQLIIDKLGWKEGIDYDSLVTATDVNKSRPNPDMILYAMKRFGIEAPAEVVKVGDSIIDIEEGKNAGCGLTIGITSGAHNLKQLQSASPDFIIDDLMELLPLIEQRVS